MALACGRMAPACCPPCPAFRLGPRLGTAPPEEGQRDGLGGRKPVWVEAGAETPIATALQCAGSCTPTPGRGTPPGTASPPAHPGVGPSPPWSPSAPSPRSPTSSEDSQALVHPLQLPPRAQLRFPGPCSQTAGHQHCTAVRRTMLLLQRCSSSSVSHLLPPPTPSPPQEQALCSQPGWARPGPRRVFHGLWGPTGRACCCSGLSSPPLPLPRQSRMQPWAHAWLNTSTHWEELGVMVSGRKTLPAPLGAEQPLGEGAAGCCASPRPPASQRPPNVLHLSHPQNEFSSDVASVQKTDLFFTNTPGGERKRLGPPMGPFTPGQMQIVIKESDGER